MKSHDWQLAQLTHASWQANYSVTSFSSPVTISNKATSNFENWRNEK
jgi:hypothetical protein